MTTKRHQGLTFCHSLPGELAQCGFHRTLQPLLLAAARGRTLCRVNGVCPPEFPTSFCSPSPHPVPCPLSYHRDCAFAWQVCLQSSNVRKLFWFPPQPPYKNSSQYPVWALKKYLAVMALQTPTNLGSTQKAGIEVGETRGTMAQLWGWSSLLCTRTATRTTSFFARENVRVVECGQIEIPMWKHPFWDRIWMLLGMAWYGNHVQMYISLSLLRKIGIMPLISWRTSIRLLRWSSG